MRQAVPLVACLATTENKPLAAMTFRFVFDVIRNQPGTFELEETFAALRKSSLDRTMTRQIHLISSSAQTLLFSFARPRVGRLIMIGGKGLMTLVHLRNTILAICILTLFTLIFLVSGAAQTELKYTDAATYYKDAKCVVCHGQAAEKKFNAEDKDEELVKIILQGKKPEKPPNMPAFEPKGLTADQAKAMVDYMRSLKKQ